MPDGRSTVADPDHQGPEWTWPATVHGASKVGGAQAKSGYRPGRLQYGTLACGYGGSSAQANPSQASLPRAGGGDRRTY